jgi:alpha,alpha-trehalase
VHYRQVPSAGDARRVEALVDRVHGECPTLRKMGGKKVFEIQPDIPWDKGEAAIWIAGQLQWSPEQTVIIYIGDDVTDEFAFRALRQQQWGIGIRVGDPSVSSDALYYLRDCDQVRAFLEGLLAAVSDGSDAIA